MPHHVSLDQLVGLGIELAPHEAVGIVQQLIEQQELAKSAGTQRGELHTPLQLGDVELGSDGSVHGSADATVTQMAGLLDALLPVRGGAVPDELELIVARSLNARGPKALADFSASLRPFEQGSRRAIVRNLFEAVDSLLRSSTAERASDEIGFVDLEAQAALDAFSPETAVPVPEPPRLQLYVAEREPEPRPEEREPELRLGELEPDPVSAVAGTVSIDRNDAPAQPAQPAREPARPPARIGWKGAAAVAAIAALIAAGSLLLALRQSPPNRSDGQTTDPSPVAADSAPADPVADRSSTQTELPQLATVNPHALPGFSPAFASQGSVVFFHTGGRGADKSDLAMTEIDRDERRVTTIIRDGARNYHVQPSPDGRLIAFDSDRDGERGVYVANSDGSDVRRISGPGYAAIPTWAPPDGRRIAFVRAEAGRPSVWNLWVLSMDSGAMQRITRYRYGQTWGASWFPDGNRIAYTYETKIIVRNLVTGDTRDFNSPIANRLVRTAAVSPDGRRVMFQVYRDGAWILNLGDGSMKRVLADPTAEEFAWAPDGRVAFHARRQNRWGIQVAAFSP